MQNIPIYAGRITAILFLSFNSLTATPSESDPNEGLRLTSGISPDLYSLSWWGKMGNTYFIQYSDDLVSPWSYIPAIESGNNAPVTYGFSNTATRFFFRLRFTEQLTSNPNADDFDGDGVSNWDELQQGTDPFAPLGARLAITWPPEGATIPARTVDVHGTWGAIASLHSLTINGVPVFISSNTWSVRALPLVNGQNTLVIVSKDNKGIETTLTRSFTADFSTSDPNPVTIEANVVEGAIPLTVTFTSSLNIAGTIQSVTYSFEGLDTAPGITDLSPINFTYATAGTYYPSVTIKLTSGASYSSGGQFTPVTERLTIKAGALQDTPASAWINFSQAILRQDAEATKTLLGIDKRDAWMEKFTTMGPVESAQLVADMANIEEVVTLQDVAQYSVTINTTLGTLTFPINFIKEDEEWKIDEF